MNYALNLAEDGRVLSVTFKEYAPADAVFADELPEGNVYDFRYVNGTFVYDPLPVDRKEFVSRRIVELKQKLSDTDYNIIKVVEGAAALSDMADIIEQRAQWRKEINELETELG